MSVEAVDPVFQTKMLDMLEQVGRYVLHEKTREQSEEDGEGERGSGGAGERDEGWTVRRAEEVRELCHHAHSW